MNQKRLTIQVNHKFRYKPEYDYYTIQMKRKRRPWWLLLFLLPLLLLKCQKDISVTCVDEETLACVEDMPVSLHYTAHYLWHSGRFFSSVPVSRTQTTDENGNTVFKDLPCSVYSYIFYNLSNVTFKAKDNCHQSKEVKRLFHYAHHVILKMSPRLEELHVRIKDAETDDLLPDATLIYQYRDMDGDKEDSVKTDVTGVATIPHMRYCSTVTLTGRCYGYADTTKIEVPCMDLLTLNEESTLRLRPIKDRFTFFVKNKDSKQPIPDVLCKVTLTRPIGGQVDSRDVRTSVDGKGIAAYDDAFVLSSIEILATKSHYKDGVLENGPWVVENFMKQNDEVRTIWLEPDPYLVEYMDVDSINGKPISGARNKIKVIDLLGQERSAVEVSNANGVFPVIAKESSRVEIDTEANPLYKQKRTVIAEFSGKEKIKMIPNTQKTNFRTVKSKGEKTLLPQCRLKVKGSISGTLPPSNSGNGEFEVEARLNEALSIEASKEGYNTNNTSVKNIPIAKLVTRKDIPLTPNVFYSYSKSIQGVLKDCYDLVEDHASFIFTWKTCPQCTMLTVVDDNGTILAQYGIDSPQGNGQGKVYPPQAGTTTISSSTQSICIIVQNVNGCNCEYTIKVL